MTWLETIGQIIWNAAAVEGIFIDFVVAMLIGMYIVLTWGVKK